MPVSLVTGYLTDLRMCLSFLQNLDQSIDGTSINTDHHGFSNRGDFSVKAFIYTCSSVSAIVFDRGRECDLTNSP